MATATRIYYVNADGVERLVRASHPSAALMHVARDYTVRVATQDDLVNCLIEGVKPENAKEEVQPEPETPKEPVASLPLWPASMPGSQQSAELETLPPDGDEEDEVGPVLPATASRQRALPRYRDALTGSTWSGRGLKPTWLRIALDSGKTLADFEI